MKALILAAAFGLGLAVSGAAYATDAAATAPAATAAAKPDQAAKEARSQECSKEADAKGLHGKERKKFREKCKKGDK
jgi:ribosomal protein L12E/L44/L45/RPP1/RPP2